MRDVFSLMAVLNVFVLAVSYLLSNGGFAQVEQIPLASLAGSVVAMCALRCRLVTLV